MRRGLVSEYPSAVNMLKPHKFAKANFYPIFSSFSLTQSWEPSLLVRTEISGQYIKPLSADSTKCCHKMGNLPLPIQMHLS